MVDGGGADVMALKRAIVFCLGRWWEATVTRLFMLLYGPWTKTNPKLQKIRMNVIFVLIDCPKLVGEQNVIFARKASDQSKIASKRRSQHQCSECTP